MRFKKLVSVILSAVLTVTACTIPVGSISASDSGSIVSGTLTPEQISDFEKRYDSDAEADDDSDNTEPTAVTTNNVPVYSGKCGEKVRWQLESGVLTISGEGDMYNNSTSPFSSVADKVTSVIVEYGVTSIGANAFRNVDIKEIELCESLTAIKTAAFYTCSNLSSLSIPESVEVIEEGAFPSQLMYRSNDIFYVDTWAVGCDENITYAAINYGTKGIAERAFENAKNLESAEIPDSVDYINHWAFHKCGKLNAVFIYNRSCKIYDDEGTFSNDSTGSYDGVIAGYRNSTAQTYADKYYRAFVSIGGSLPPTDYEIIPAVTDVTGKGVALQGARLTQPENNVEIKLDMFLKNVKSHGCDIFVKVGTPLQITSVSNAGAKNFTDGNKTLEAVYFTADYLTTEKSFSTLTISVPQGCPSGEYPITISYGMIDDDGHEVEKPIAYNNKIIVERADSPSTTAPATTAPKHTTTTTYWTDDDEPVKIPAPSGVDGKGVAIEGLVMTQPEYDRTVGLGMYFRNVVSQGLAADISSPFEISQVSNSSLTSYSDDSHTYARILFLSGEPYSTDKPFSEVYITIPKDCPAGEYKIALSNIELDDNMNYAANPTYYGGEITIKPRSSPVTTYPVPTTAPSTTTTKPATTVTKPTTSTTKPAVTGSFKWGRDNWNFLNNSTYFNRGTYYLKDYYIDTLKKNTDNKEWVKMEKALNSTWRGSCHGMSSVALLAKAGYMTYGVYTSGADCLNKVKSPAESDEVESLINYYHFLQLTDIVRQEFYKAMSRSHEENINAILESLETSEEVLVGFQHPWIGGHTVVAYGSESGLWNIGGVTYQKRIDILDPNFSTEFNESACIYFNPKTYAWTIPAYKVSSAGGASFNLVLSDIDIINSGGYLEEIHINLVGNYIASLEFGREEGNDFSINKFSIDDGIFKNQAIGEDEIMSASFYISGGEDEGSEGYLLKDSKAGYKITQKSYNKMNLKLDYENCAFEADAPSCKEMLFDPSGYAELNGSATDYSIDMVYNEGFYPTDWYRIRVSGTNTDNVSLSQTDGGYIMSGDNLTEVKILANNDNTEAEREFTADCGSVFIYEIDENTIGIKIDADGNGTYETELDGGGDKTRVPDDAEPTVYGDTNLDGAVNVADVVQINKFLLNKKDNPIEGESLANADCMRDGYIDSSDSTLLMNYVSMQITIDQLGKK